MGKLSEGQYFAPGVETAMLTKAKTSGNPQLELEIHITHKADAGDWVALPMTEKRTLYWSMTEAAMPYTEAKLKALMFNGDFGMPQFGVNEVILNLEFEEYQGKQKERWELASWGDRPQNEKCSDDVVRRFNTLWKSANAPKPGGNGKAPPKPAPKQNKAAMDAQAPVAAGVGEEPPF